MIKSMTGFGRGSAGKGPNKIDVEIRTVNSRFLETKIRGFNLDSILELKVRNTLETSLQRGNVQVRFELQSSQDSQKLSFNRKRFEILQDVVKKIHVDYGQRMNLSDIISTNDLLTADEPENLKPGIILKAVELALNQVNEMREKEGHQIQTDISNRMELLQSRIDEVGEISGKFTLEKQIQMRKKISELFDGETLDETRLIQEVAFLSERADVTEEIVRCKSHFTQLSSYMNQEEPVGKRINFLIQEIGREVNTIGSKSPQPAVTNHVIEIKGELEKIREQVQNIL
ncbi:MAG: YicC/YloC family endoribonuclease [Candidatus Neomarinimicrobiota bacterium]|nr:YicC/YloC family endoribonuclease [Candidatus Neomarinimicrobiota bacterium]